jgi:ubiquinone/menaquinone biosynthesis C-methylase UbiE
MDRTLIPPDDLIVQNAIGVNDKQNIAAEFDAIGHGLIKEMVNNGFIKPETRVLDVGCGLGRTARALTKILNSSGAYIGLDTTKSSIEWCLENYSSFKNFTFIWSDVYSTFYNPSSQQSGSEYKFPVADNSIDFCYSTSLFTHLTLPVADNYLSEIHRVLRPGGKTWNTFLLLDEVSEPLAKRQNPARPNMYLPFPIEGGLVAIPHNPEALIGFYTHVIEGLHSKYGLRVLDLRNGPWSGRTDNIRAGHQDVVIAEKR